MNLDALRLFVAVVHSGSLSKAASTLSIPIATLSRQLARLEKSLGCQLLHRSRFGAVPTIEGQKLYEQVCVPMDTLLNAAQYLNDATKLSGVLRVSAMIGFDKLWALLGDFWHQYPHITIHYQATDGLVDLLADGIDVAFRVGSLHNDQVVAYHLFDLSAIWVASPALLQRVGMPDTLASLGRFALAGFARLGQRRLAFETDEAVWYFDCAFSSNDNAAVLHWAMSGQGVALMSAHTAATHIATGALVQVLPTYISKPYPVHALWLPHRQRSAVLGAFVDFLKAS